MKIFVILGSDLPESLGNIMQMVGSGNIHIGIMGDGYVFPCFSNLSYQKKKEKQREREKYYRNIILLQRC